MPSIPNLSPNRKQYRCKKCYHFHTLFYLQGLEEPFILAYEHPTPKRKFKHSELIFVPMIVDLPIEIEQSKELKEKTASLLQERLF